MKITRENYESYFLDYLEGNLKEELIDQFLDFLNQNQDLKEELQLFDNFRLPEEEIVFPGKEQLHKGVADENAALENNLIACMEGDLEDQERHSFENYLAIHPELKSEYNLFFKTRMVPDSAIRFPDKKKLYRKSGSVILINWVGRAAALIVLFWGINSLLQKENPSGKTSNQAIAKIEVRRVIPTVKIEENKKSFGPEFPDKQEAKRKTNSEKTSNNPEYLNAKAQDILPENMQTDIRELSALAEIKPRVAQLKESSIENQLVISPINKMLRVNDAPNIVSLDDFLASRVKKVGDEGLQVANRFARLGLGLASGLSGDRIGYKVKDGKITSVDFESKLMAFSIPLKKE
jgi:hypothetical protein